jgi:glycosyltransferase involved in cell wall biosynthesis
VKHILCTSWLPADAKSGVSTYIRNLRRFFEKDPEIRISFLSVDDAPLFWRVLAGLARRIVRIPAFIDRRFIELSFEIRYRLLIRGALSRHRRHRFDLINAQDILSGHTAKKFFRGKTPLVLTCHFNDSPVEEDILRYRLNPRAKVYLENRYKAKFRHVDRFIFVAAYTIRKVRPLLPEEARTTVIYNGLDFSHPRRKTTGHAVLSILNTGHVEERKNQRLFIPIAGELLRRGFSDFRITIVGQGPDLAFLESTVAQEGLGDHILFAGWTDDIATCLADADVYIHTSLNDTCPYSVVEAIAARIPVLAFNVGGLPEMLPEDCLFAPNDHVALVDHLLDNIRRLPDLAARQFERAKDDFSHTVQIERLRSIYLFSSITHEHDKEISPDTEKEPESAERHRFRVGISRL